jgi:hypothetical protein
MFYITLDIYPNNLIIFICMLKDQANLFQRLESFQIDLSFKRIKGDINEFEINSYNNEHKLSKFLFINFFKII